MKVSEEEDPVGKVSLVQGRYLTTTPRAFTPRVIFPPHHRNLKQRRGGVIRCDGRGCSHGAAAEPGGEVRVESHLRTELIRLIHQGEERDDASLKRRAPSSPSLATCATAPLCLSLPPRRRRRCLAHQRRRGLPAKLGLHAHPICAAHLATLAAAHGCGVVVPEHHPTVQTDADSVTVTELDAVELVDFLAVDENCRLARVGHHESRRVPHRGAVQGAVEGRDAHVDGAVRCLHPEAPHAQLAIVPGADPGVAGAHHMRDAAIQRRILVEPHQPRHPSRLVVVFRHVGGRARGGYNRLVARALFVVSTHFRVPSTLRGFQSLLARLELCSGVAHLLANIEGIPSGRFVRRRLRHRALWS